ncbi:thioredoxin domain-containing protein [Spirosoma sp. KNUC1025]|uniref:DsbA family protein n=1 Tax=Spirosoma sp. KNUC1025 TaxID=2894082 RepID=UPI001E3964AB|nr:thioredoxin domain-containing protein [Spirosoma sp. KNUC1025]UFH57670.1 DsbA family protein [Spirosoma sp. KNUC1025]
MSTYQPGYFTSCELLNITEFGDVTTSQSRIARQIISASIAPFYDQIEYRYRYFPDLKKTESVLAAIALEAAKRQHKFQLMYNALLSLPTINTLTLIKLASTLGLVQDRFIPDLLCDHIHTIIKSDWLEGTNLSLNQAPALFVNGHRFHGKFTSAKLTPFVSFHLEQSRKPSSITNN